jgi:hypothetical protein
MVLILRMEVLTLYIQGAQLLKSSPNAEWLILGLKIRNGRFTCRKFIEF